MNRMKTLSAAAIALSMTLAFAQTPTPKPSTGTTQSTPDNATGKKPHKHKSQHTKKSGQAQSTTSAQTPAKN